MLRSCFQNGAHSSTIYETLILNFVLFHLADEMDRADDELRDTIRNIWPLQARKMMDMLIPQRDGK